MLRRIALMLALATVVAPSAARAHEWEEDYTDDWSAEAPPDAAVVADATADVDVDASVTFDTFHGALSPYGEWVVAGSYGRVWRPHVAAGWRPYYYGRWEWTNEGWLWVSEEPFGWAAYHYGRWALDPYFGWIWVPGYQWAPAWVSWRYSGDVVGWAPLGPGVSVFVSVSTFHDNWWTFVPCRSFVAHPVYRVAYQPSFTRRHWHATTPAPAYRGRPGFARGPSPAWGGPPPRTIEQRIGRPVTPVRVVPAPSPGAARLGNGEVAMYRPGLRGWDGPRRGDPGALRGDRSPGPRVDARSAPGFRSDDARRGPAFRGDDRPRFQSGTDRGQAGVDRSQPGVDRGGQVRRFEGFQPGGQAPRGQERGAPSVAPVPAPSTAVPAPTPRQDAPRFVPRGWSGPAAAPQQGAAPRAERSWPQSGGRGGAELRGGGEFRGGGGGSGGGAPRTMTPSRGGGDRGGGGRMQR